MASKVLVLIPTLTRPIMCRRAVESLLRQDFASWDLAIIKNGPAKLAGYTRALADVLEHPRIHLLSVGEAGLGNALNEGFTHFHHGHQYFANLEDDDEWNPAFLRLMYKEAQRSGADVTHCLQHQEPDRRQSNGGPMDTALIRRRNWINFPMCLFRSSLFRKTGGFCTDAGPATDWDWHLRCLQAGGRYHFVPETLVTHHWHGGNYCLQSNGEYVRKRLKEGAYG